MCSSKETIPAWVKAVSAAENDRDGLKIMLRGVYELLSVEDFKTIDAILASLDWETLSPTIMMGYIRCTFVAKDRLDHWLPSLKEVHGQLVKQNCSDRILMGLTQYLHEGETA